VVGREEGREMTQTLYAHMNKKKNEGRDFMLLNRL
jgi:hypothetical protein